MKRVLIAAAVVLQMVRPDLADRLSGWLHVRAVNRALACQRGRQR